MTKLGVSSRIYQYLKRLFDISLALLLFVVCTPLLLYCYWLVWRVPPSCPATWIPDSGRGKSGAKI